MKNKKTKKYLSVIVVLLCGGVVACSSEETSTTEPSKQTEIANVEADSYLSEVPVTKTSGRIRYNDIGSFAIVFNDSNKYQYAYAEKLGIDPIADLSQTYCAKRPIVKIESGEYYQVDTLTHSLPYLVPEAAELLKTIGRNFIDTLASRGGSGYKIKVTSLLRTPSTVKRLRRVNINATDSSTHQFGTTFDISHTNFYCYDSSSSIDVYTLKCLLAEVLLDLRRKEMCMVKYERKTGCFHVTVTK